MKNPRNVAEKFLRLVTSGKIREAYGACISPDFRHHNPYFKGDAASLMKGMEENEQKFPHKKFRILHSVQEDDMVITHSRISLSADQPEIAVCHIFRIQDGLIAEMWDIGQQVPQDMPNGNGMF